MPCLRGFLCTPDPVVTPVLFAVLAIGGALPAALLPVILPAAVLLPIISTPVVFAVAVIPAAPVYDSDRT